LVFQCGGIKLCYLQDLINPLAAKYDLSHFNILYLQIFVQS
jgi:hypothetical protein